MVCRSRSIVSCWQVTDRTTAGSPTIEFQSRFICIASSTGSIIVAEKEGKMIGISIKAGISCPACESNIPLNALVPTIECPACGTVQELSIDSWKTVLDDAIEEAPYTEEGMGSSSTIFGKYNYKLIYGRLHPRYEGTKDNIEESEILDNLDNMFVTHPETGVRTSVRELPDIYREEFKGIVALVGEEAALIPCRGEGRELDIDNSGKPTAIQCPQCGGSLIVSGSNRSETCRYCETKVHLPDDLWRILHPVKTMKTWFLLCDRGKRPFKWGSDICSAVYAGEGRICVVVENDYGDLPIVACLKKDRTPVWVRDDLHIECSTEDSPPGMMNTPEGHFLVMADNNRDLLMISAEDGSVLKVVQGSEVEVESLPQDRFTMEDCCGITCLPDGNIIQLRSMVSERDGYCQMFLRFDLDGHRLPLWPPADMEGRKKTGFLSRLKELFIPCFERISVPRYIEDFEDRPEKVQDSELDLCAGPDGSLYMLRYNRLAAFDPNGIKRYSIELPCSTVHGRPVANGEGEAFLIASLGDGTKQVLRISGDGLGITILGASAKDGGLYENLQTLVLEPDGTVQAFGYSGNWITLENHPHSGSAAD